MCRSLHVEGGKWWGGGNSFSDPTLSCNMIKRLVAQGVFGEGFVGEVLHEHIEVFEARLQAAVASPVKGLAEPVSI
jgi:hypothetical protein